MQFTEGKEKHSPLQLLSPSLVCSILLANELLEGRSIYPSLLIPFSTLNLRSVHALQSEEGANLPQHRDVYASHPSASLTPHAESSDVEQHLSLSARQLRETRQIPQRQRVHQHALLPRVQRVAVQRVLAQRHTLQHRQV